MKAYVYRIKPVKHGYSVCAVGSITCSLPYGTKDEAERVVRRLVKKYPGSIYVD